MGMSSCVSQIFFLIWHTYWNQSHLRQFPNPSCIIVVEATKRITTESLSNFSCDTVTVKQGKPSNIKCQCLSSGWWRKLNSFWWTNKQRNAEGGSLITAATSVATLFSYHVHGRLWHFKPCDYFSPMQISIVSTLVWKHDRKWKLSFHLASNVKEFLLQKKGSEFSRHSKDS